jgi:hypothetical protein
MLQNDDAIHLIGNSDLTAKLIGYLACGKSARGSQAQGKPEQGNGRQKSG